MLVAEEHSPLPVVWSELLLGGILFVIPIIVAVVSYRRSRCLTGHPVYKSLAIAVVNGLFWPFWILLSILDRRQTAKDWADYHQRDAADTLVEA